jgi:hypothetical protein
MRGFRGDMSIMGDFPLLVAGEAGQASLARSADSHGLRASVDQHVAEVRDALDGRLTEGLLLSYARGFVEAAVARGWWPPHRLAGPFRGPAIESLASPGGLADSGSLADPGGLPGSGGLADPGDLAGSGSLVVDEGRAFAGLDDAHGWLPDWESLRLAAVCHLFLETQGLTLTV